MRNYEEDRKRQFWELLIAAAIMSGRKTNAEALATADLMVEEVMKRWPKEAEDRPAE